MSTDPQDMDFGAGEEVDIPDDPGPALTGKTPVVGTLRRNNDLPVARDELADEVDDLDVGEGNSGLGLGLLEG